MDHEMSHCLIEPIDTW